MPVPITKWAFSSSDNLLITSCCSMVFFAIWPPVQAVMMAPAAKTNKADFFINIDLFIEVSIDNTILILLNTEIQRYRVF